jgi:hypothetical protein
MKLEDFSLRQVAIGIPALVFAYWAAMQFVILPHMSDERRRHGRRIVVFAMALGSACGWLLEVAIRSYWHI